MSTYGGRGVNGKWVLLTNNHLSENQGKSSPKPGKTTTKIRESLIDDSLIQFYVKTTDKYILNIVLIPLNLEICNAAANPSFPITVLRILFA